ncbi:MAG TPA: RluA family pseudouridine synthase [Cyclobacteriaceae bacterium]|nr:RluA family pseudouridine synthase [Cyclobacteriaceae bacterium]
MQIHIPDHILYEDDFIIVLDKPAGLMVEPDRNGYPNLLHQLKKYIKVSSAGQDEVYAQHIHRLDRPVSGIVLFAKQRSVLKNLSEQFAERRVRKYYQALTEHAPKEMKGRLEHWHRKEKKKAVLYDHEIEYTEKAILTYEVKNVPTARFLWDIELHTGKYHQIRAQLGALGCPIIGDSLYGSTQSYRPDALALRAWKLIFYHPITNEEKTVETRHELDSTLN